MAIYITAVQAAQLVKEVGFPPQDQATMVAIGQAESHLQVDAVSKPNSNGSIDRAWLQINSVHNYDARLLTSDARYTAVAGKAIYDGRGAGRGLTAWSTYNNGAYQQYMPEARQAVAGAGNVVGAPPIGGSDPAADKTVVYGPLGPQIIKAGTGVALQANQPTPTGNLGTLRIIGQEIGADVGLTVIDEPKFAAGMDTIPHVDFTVIDPERAASRGLFSMGNRLTWLDLDLRIDTATFAPGEHGSGQAAFTAQDDIVFALRNLRGPSGASGISASTWLYRELSTVGMTPDLYLLAEAVPTQSMISRDVPDPNGAVSDGEVPSAWTTIVRLAEELGKWVFVSGRRIVFGSAKFAMQWCASSPVPIGWDGAPPSEQFVTAPTATRTSVVERVNILEITGRVPHQRAHLFRPGCAVDCYGVLGVANPRSDPVRMMVMSIEHTLANDTDGADVVLIEPVDPPPKPPGQTNKNALNPNGPLGITGGGADGQIEDFVRIALSQTGKRYIFGAEASKTDPNPRAFDCCLSSDALIATVDRGRVSIARINPGEWVWSWSDEGRRLIPCRVTAVAEQPVQLTYQLRVGDQVIRASANHPFARLAAPDATHWDWARLDQLVPGDVLIGLRHGSPTVNLVQGVEPHAQEVTYDLEIEGAHNYFAEGLLVHNSELVEWSAARAGIPNVPDGSAAQINACEPITVAQAITIRGALLGHPGHIAISLGNGRTIEASSSDRPIGQLDARGRFTQGGLIRGAKGYRR